MDPRARRRDTFALRLARWCWALLIALAAHLALFSFLAATGALKLFHAPGPVDVKPVALRTLSESAWAANRKLDPNAPKLPQAQNPFTPEQKKQEQAKKEEMPKGRVVDVAPGNGQKPPEDSEFLAERDNRVDKQTRSKHATPNYKNATPQPSTTLRPSENKGGRDQTDRDVIAGNGGKGDEDKPMKEGKNGAVFEIPDVKKSDKLALKQEGDGAGLSSREESEAIKGNSDRLRIQAGDEMGRESEGSAGKAGVRDLQTLTPSIAVFDRVAGAPANDLTPMDDLEEGEGTWLNTKEWKHSSFFNRIKQNVGMHWNPNAVVRYRDPTGEIFLYKDRYTVVSVTLDEGGSLKSVTVDKSSGVDFLDGEAVAAFQRAQPFPNPPRALRDDHGEIRFTFGFYLEVDRGGLKLFRP